MGEVHGLFVVKARYRVGAATGAEAEELVRDFVGDKGKVSGVLPIGRGSPSLGNGSSGLIVLFICDT